MKKKYLFSMLIVFALMLVLCTVSALAADTASGVCGEHLTWALSDEGVLTISGNGEMLDYTYDSFPWYNYKSSINSVVFENGVTSVGDNSFHSCYNLYRVSLADTILSIGEAAFCDCKWMESFTNSNNLVSIGEYAFYLCASLSSIDIPSTVSSIATTAFSMCSGLGAINVSPNNQYYHSYDGVLYELASNTVIKCPISYTGSHSIIEGTTHIAQYAFLDCASLTEIIIPESVVDIGFMAFSNCTSLSHILIYSTSPKITSGGGGASFSGCSMIKSAGPIGGNYDYEFAWIDIPDVAFYGLTGLQSIKIPDGAKSIGSEAFRSCSSLMFVTLPESLETIGGLAFYECPLTSITIPPSVKTIEDYAFYNCINLKAVYITDLEAWCNIDFKYRGANNTGANPLYFARNLYLNNELVTTLIIPDTVNVVKRHTFYRCNSIEKVVFPDSISHISYLSFSDCENLKYISFEPTQIVIDSWAFFGCNQISEIIFNGTKSQWNTISIGTNNDPLRNATINYGKYSINYNVNGGYNTPVEQIKDKGEPIQLTNSIPIREDWYFLGWAENAEATDPDYLPSSFFAQDTDIILYSVWAQPDCIFPANLATIEESAFENCGFRFGVLSDNTVEIQRNAFSNSSTLKYILIPAATATIDKDAFTGTADVTILGISGSKVEEFALQWGLSFVPLVSVQ